MKRTFQVAVFGASDAANKKLLASLHRARGGELVDVPESTTTARFFDYDVKTTRFRVGTTYGGNLTSRAFLGLFGVSALVFVPSGQDAAAWSAVRDHLATYGDMLVMIASATPQPKTTGILVPPTGAALADAIEAHVLDAFRAGRTKGRPTTTPSKAYTSRATALARAADLAIQHGPRNMRRFHQSLRAMALHPALGFATTSSLASLEGSLFTYWNEAYGAKVDTFWREVAKLRLPFTRRNVVAEVLARGRISNREDYETVTDLVSDDRLTSKQRQRLSAMLDAYESRGRRAR